MAVPSSAPVTQSITQIIPEIHNMAPITGFVKVFGVETNPSVIVLVCVLCSLGYVLWKGQRAEGKNTFDVWDLVMDTLPNGSRRTSGIKTAYQFAFLLSSWVVVDNQIKGTLSEGIFGLYLGTWCASLIAKVIFDKQDPPKLPAKDA